MKVKIENIGVIKKADLEFKPGINLIIGSSGSGKSTLLRSMYNIATNSFSDSDISFNENKMTMTVCCDDNNVVEYCRYLKTNGDKCYYNINGKNFVKLGRQTLPAVADVLKINDIEINGEKVNFNFNMQFSTPFLILGSQSTLYNVLTYRSTFDISSINDYYVADIKSNNSELSTTKKLKEKLSANLEGLEKQAQQLEPVEQIYSLYMVYKHKLELVNDLKNLLSKHTNLNKLTDTINKLNTIINNINNSINTFNKVFTFDKYSQMYNMYNKMNNAIGIYSDSISSHSNAIKTIQNIASMNKAQLLLANKNTNDNRIKILKACVCSSSKFINKNGFIVDLVKQYKYLITYNKHKDILSILENNNDNIINTIDELLYVNNKLNLYNNQCNNIIQYDKQIDLVNNKINEFNICPLCGKPLNNNGECSND